MQIECKSHAMIGLNSGRDIWVPIDYEVLWDGDYDRNFASLWCRWHISISYMYSAMEGGAIPQNQ